jgi:hypothetical protein
MIQDTPRFACCRRDRRSRVYKDTVGRATNQIPSFGSVRALNNPRREIWDVPRSYRVGMAAFVLSILITVTLPYQELMEIHQGGFFLEKLPMILLITFFPSIAEDILTCGNLHRHLKSLKSA